MCELDIIFNFEKAYFILDELVLGGELQETSKKNVLKAIAAQDLLQEVNIISTFHYPFMYWIKIKSLSVYRKKLLKDFSKITAWVKAVEKNTILHTY